MPLENANFSERVEELVRQIPQGRVMTYGQLAAMAGNAKAARIVGGIAHFGDPNLPWQRVVNKKGGLAAGYPGGRLAHKQHLESEGVIVSGEEGNYQVDIAKILYEPYANKLDL
jgi:methylated-DNA-protein-cysteine methyltransferase related protein